MSSKYVMLVQFPRSSYEYNYRLYVPVLNTATDIMSHNYCEYISLGLETRWQVALLAWRLYIP
jgi:hypothetical protein